MVRHPHDGRTEPMHDAEDRRVRPDAECEGEHRDGREPGAFVCCRQAKRMSSATSLTASRKRLRSSRGAADWRRGARALFTGMPSQFDASARAASSVIPARREQDRETRRPCMESEE